MTVRESVQELYSIACKNNITVDKFPFSKVEAMSLMDLDGQCFIGLNPATIRSDADERNKLAHELGHCLTGAFYNQYSSFDCRQRHENTARKWEIAYLLPFSALEEAVASGYTEAWQLSELFSVPEALIRDAVCWYNHGNLAADVYL